MKKYAVILGNLGNTRDRFMGDGYKQAIPTEQMIAQAASIDGIRGLELVGNWDITPKNQDKIARLLHDHGLMCVSLIPDIFGRSQWGSGALASRDAQTRQAAINEIRKCCDIAENLGCHLINIWPGQDGYDYAFTHDYRQDRQYLTEGIAHIAQAYPSLRIALEYKVKEPRTHSYLARMADTLLIAQATGLDNVGVCIDTGHSMMAYENLGEVVAMAGERLFHMHFNDNYRSWDDDMIVGSVHTVEYIELLYWLNRVGYDGWYSMDQYPYRENGRDAVEQSLKWLVAAEEVVDHDRNVIDDLLVQGDPVKVSDYLRSRLFSSCHLSRSESATC